MTPRRRRALVASLTAPLALLLAAALAAQAIRQADFVPLAIRRIEPHVPFRIEALELDWKWRDFRVASPLRLPWGFSGHLPSLSTVLHWGPWRLRLHGPVSIDRDAARLVVHWDPVATIEPAEPPPGDVARPSAEVTLSLDVRTDAKAKVLRALALDARAERFDFGFYPPLAALKLDQGARVQAAWSVGPSGVGRATARVELGTAAWDPDAEHAVHLAGVDVSGGAELGFAPFTLSPRIDARAAARALEALWGEAYVDTPLAAAPVEGWIERRGGQPARGRARVAGELVDVGFTMAGARGEPMSVDWKTGALDLARVLPAALKAIESSSGALGKALAPLRGLEVSRGTLRSAGSARGGVVTGRARLRGLDASWPAKQLAVRGLDLDLARASADAGFEGSLGIERLGFRKARATLGPVALSARPLHGTTGRWRVLIGGGGRLPLAIDGFAIRLATIAGDDQALHTAVDSDPFTLKSLLDALCVTPKRVPDVMLQLNLGEVRIGSEAGLDSIEPRGSVTAAAFDGKLTIHDLGLYDIASPVPELDFTAEYGGFRLDRIGEWLGFGEMDGTIEGHARDVVFQSWLPTQFDFMLQARPFRRKKIVFSPDAMRNVVRLFAGEDIEHLPGVANWLAFGWPSRVFGGYDVQYAGISLQTVEEKIIVRTLDPTADGGSGELRAVGDETPSGAEAFGLPSALAAKDHFILFGPRFRMPLRSSRYPLVVDAPAMSNYVAYMAGQLGALSDRKHAEAGATPRATPTADLDCVPRL